jgi:hypothetical protein
MTEAEWVVCTDPQPMLEFLRGKASDRKLRLFAVACCRRIWHLLDDPGDRDAVAVAERFADGWASEAVRAEAETGATAYGWFWEYYEDPRLGELSEAALAAAKAAWSVIVPDGVFLSGEDTSDLVAEASSHHLRRGEKASHCRLLRDIFGLLPFRPVTIDPAWLRWNHSTVSAVARRIYEERAFPDLPILADALEDAGCTDADLLGHCRSPGPHVRGCWAVDLLLGKA